MCPVYTADAPATASEAARAQVAAFDRALAENGDDVFAVRTRADLARVGRDDRIGLMLSLEGVEPLGEDPAAFAGLWKAGVRMAGLTHNGANAFAGGVDTPGTGLSDLGRELVDDLAARGVVIDLAHASERTFDDVLEHAPTAHVVVTHACCRAVEDHRRNLGDGQLRALAARDGVLGMMALALVVGGDFTIDRLIDHLDHAVDVMGIAHVGIGADVIDQVIEAEIAAGKPLDPVTVEAMAARGGRLGLVGLRGPDDYPALVEALRRRGYEGADLDAILRGNFLRVLGRALPA